MREGIKRMRESKDDALHALFRTAYYIAKENLPFSKFKPTFKLLKDVEAQRLTTDSYHDDKSCATFIHCISKCVMNDTITKVQKSPWFGVMVDESMDISTHHHMIIYLSYLDADCVPMTSFYGMVRTSDGTAKGLFDVIMCELRKANLDVAKLVAFGSDGCSTMVGRKNGVATLLKKVNPMLTSVHCVAHRANLAASNATKKSDYARKIDKLVNAIAVHFSSSSNRMEGLKELQEELDCEVIRMQRVFDIRWLSRHTTITKVCKCIDALLVKLKEENVSLYVELCCLEMVYALHFLADIFGVLSTLSLRFQKDHVDVTSIHGIVRNTILSIHDDFLDERPLDLNASQLGTGNYPILPDYGPDCGYLHSLRSSLRGEMIFGQNILRDKEGKDLQRALEFQMSFSKAICKNLEKRFVDNSVLACMKIVVPAQHPKQEKLLKDFGKNECDAIVNFYGVPKNVDGHIFAPFIDGENFRKEYRTFKNQAKAEFAHMSLVDITAVIACNEAYKEMYPNILCIAQVALVQCCSIAICERGFSARTRIKTKWRNRMEIESLNALLTIILEGPEEMDFTDAATLWKNDAHYRHLFT